MPRNNEEKDLPALYAFVQPGLEPIAADEITRDLHGEVKKTERGMVVFRLNEIDEDILKLRTTEDVYLLAYGSDALTFKAGDLDTIRKWTAKKPDWPQLLKLHHAVRPKTKGKPSFHIVCQMQGEHGYRRIDARQALEEGLLGVIPANWVRVEENAWFEVWLTIQSKTAICGVRLTDRTMRHRTYKTDHVAASLRPTVAAAMVRLAGIAPGMIVLDPMCGAGTILAEAVELCEQRRMRDVQYLGGDIDPNAIFCSDQNLGRRGGVKLERWDSTELPLGAESVDRIVCNPPFGKQLSTPEQIVPLYNEAVPEWDRVLRPGGRAVLLASEQDVLREAIANVGWVAQRQLRVRVLGQQATVSVWQKPDAVGRI
jgi:tRNA (guanine6-N2)-methyltransferase